MERIGGGGQGEVFKCCISSEPSKIFVSKTVKSTNNREYSRQVEQMLYREFLVGSRLQNEFVVEYKHFVKERDRGTEVFHLILEFMEGGSLKSFLKSKLSLERIKDFSRQILKGLQYLHDSNVTHQDLKP